MAALGVSPARVAILEKAELTGALTIRSLRKAADAFGSTVVSVDEIYSTKPGPEAGLRLDVLPYDDVLAFETSRWRDDGPPK